jgi:hypothetical protein
MPVKLHLEKFGQLNLGLGDHPLVEFHLGPAFAIKQHGFFAGLVDEIHAKPDQVIDSRFVLIAHSSLLDPHFLQRGERITGAGRRIKSKGEAHADGLTNAWVPGISSRRSARGKPAGMRISDTPSTECDPGGWMDSDTPTREDALALLKEFNRSESLIKHALSVEAVMRHFARQRGQDEEKWGVVGLVHDWTMTYSPTSIAARPKRSCVSAMAGRNYSGCGEPRLGNLL